MVVGQQSNKLKKAERKKGIQMHLGLGLDVNLWIFVDKTKKVFLNFPQISQRLQDTLLTKLLG